MKKIPIKLITITITITIGILHINHVQGKGEPCYFDSCDEVCFFGEDCKELPNQKSQKHRYQKNLQLMDLAQLN